MFHNWFYQRSTNRSEPQKSMKTDTKDSEILTIHPLISVVVPLYNNAQYVAACLESLQAQSMKNYEVVVVDDGSTDGGLEVVKKLALRDLRLRFFHQENAGVTKARWSGVAEAKGKYVLFVDPDDTLPVNALERFCKYIDNEHDIIVGQFNIGADMRPAQSVDMDEYRKRLIYVRMQLGACGKLIKRELFNEYVLGISREICIGEDWVMHLRLSFRSESKVLFIPEIVYNYNLRETSVTNMFKKSLTYERKIYKVLVDSVPLKYRSNYVPCIDSHMASRWCMFTNKSIFLNDFEHKFRGELLASTPSLYRKLKIADWLLFKCTSPLLRVPAIALYHTAMTTRRVLQKFKYLIIRKIFKRQR